MEIRYDSEAGALYLTIRKGEFHHNKKIDKNTIVDLDKDENILVIELLFVKENNPDLLNNISVKNLMVI